MNVRKKLSTLQTGVLPRAVPSRRMGHVTEAQTTHAPTDELTNDILRVEEIRPRTAVHNMTNVSKLHVSIVT